MNTVVVRSNEYCPECGSVNPFRKRKSTVVHGVRRILAVCRICGKKVTIIYRDAQKNA